MRWTGSRIRLHPSGSQRLQVLPKEPMRVTCENKDGDTLSGLTELASPFPCPDRRPSTSSSPRSRHTSRLSSLGSTRSPFPTPGRARRSLRAATAWRSTDGSGGSGDRELDQRVLEHRRPSGPARVPARSWCQDGPPALSSATTSAQSESAGRDKTFHNIMSPGDSAAGPRIERPARGGSRRECA